MAIKVSGAVVIDNDRSLKNVASIEYADGSVQTTALTEGSYFKKYNPGTLLHIIDNPNAYNISDGDNFGKYLAVSGNYAVVGAPYEDDRIIGNNGIAYIIDITTNTLIHTLNNPSVYNNSAFYSDRFGVSVSISDNYCAIASNEMLIYVFNVTTGTLVNVLTKPGLYNTGANFGNESNISMSGNYLIVGAKDEDDAGGASSGSGKAYIFNVTTGALVWTLNNPNAYSTSEYDQFGRSVAIDGNYAIVGAPWEDDSQGIYAGKAYIFNVTTGALVWTLNDPNAYSTSEYDNFGISVSISGNYCIVGAYGESEYNSTPGYGDYSGKAYIFNVTTGALVHTLNNPNIYGVPGNDYFGKKVSISGDYCVVGVPNETGNSLGTAPLSGAAYIFNVTTGELVHALNNPNAYSTSIYDEFGISVAISGNYCVVGAYGESDPGGYGGKVYVFNIESIGKIKRINSLKMSTGIDIANTLKRLTKISKSTGTLIHTFHNPNAYSTRQNDEFGRYSIGISDNYVVIGAGNEDIQGSLNSGRIYVFNAITGELIRTIQHPNISGGSSANETFGTMFRVFKNYMIVGVYGEYSGSGSAYIIDLRNGKIINSFVNPNVYSYLFNDDYFGNSVAISGDYVIIGAPYEDSSGYTDEGKVYIFNIKTNELITIIANPNTFGFGSNDLFGIDVAISGRYCAISAWEDNAVYSNTGTVYIYDIRSGVRYFTLTKPYQEPEEYFGDVIAMYGNYLVVSSRSDLDSYNTGQVHVFDVLQGKLLYTLNNPNVYSTGYSDEFGASISVSSKYIAIGSYEDQPDGLNSGKVYIYNLKTGALIHILSNPNVYGTSTNDYFGYAVSITDNYCLVSAPFEEGSSVNGTDSGVVYMFAIDNISNLDRLYTLVS